MVNLLFSDIIPIMADQGIVVKRNPNVPTANAKARLVITVSD
jgi:hypothetical protein